MPEIEPIFLKIAVAAHPQLPDAILLSSQIAQVLDKQGVSVIHGLLYDENLKQCITERQVGLLIALGGDGTMLRAGHLCGPVGIPILGINVGRFGFLSEIPNNQWREMLPQLFTGNFWLEKRMMLNAEQWRGAERLGSWDVLNEVVVSRGHYVRPVRLAAHVDGRYLTTYVADAVIAATATGSTAYSLAAGGPILPPELRTILLTAVAPHLSIDRAIVLPEGSSVTILTHHEGQAILSLDGQAPIPLEEGDRVEARASEHTVQFIRFQDPGYFYRNLIPLMSRNPSTGDHQ